MRMRFSSRCLWFRGMEGSIANLFQDKRDCSDLSTRASNAALNALTGFQERHVYSRRIEPTAEYEMEDELRPYMSTFENQYVPEDVFNAMSPSNKDSTSFLRSFGTPIKKQENGGWGDDTRPMLLALH